MLWDVNEAMAGGADEISFTPYREYNLCLSLLNYTSPAPASAISSLPVAASLSHSCGGLADTLAPLDPTA